MNYELYRSALKAQAQVKSDIKFFKKIFKSDENLAKSRDTDIVNAARSVLAEYGITRSEKTADEWLSKIKAYDPDTYANVTAMTSDAISGAKDYNSISFDQFVKVSDTVKALYDLSKTEKESVIEGEKMQTEKIEEELIQNMMLLSDTRERAGYDKKVSHWQKTKMTLLGARAALTRVENWADAMGPSFLKYIFNPIKEAETKFKAQKKDLVLKYLELLKPIESTLDSKEKIYSPELNYEFSGLQELLGALLHTGNDSNFDKLLMGRKDKNGITWGDKQDDNKIDRTRFNTFINKMINDGKLQKAHFDFLQATWDLLESIKPDAQKAHKQMYGFYFNEVTANEFTNQFGTYRGGYVPAIADSFLSEDAKVRADKDQLENNNNSFMFPSSPKGFTKSRTEKYYAPLVMDLKMIPSHIDKVTKFIYLGPRVKEVSRLVMSKTFRDSLANIDSEVASEMLVPWLQRSARQQVAISGQGTGWRTLDSIATALRSRTGLQTLSLNVTNSLQQLTGFSISMVKVSPKYFGQALYQFIRQPNLTTQEVCDKSDYMKSRNTTSVMEITGHIDNILLNPSKLEQLQQFALEHGKVISAKTQHVVDNVTWVASYNEAIEQNMSEAQAVRHADRAVRMTQGDFDPSVISRLEAGSPFMRLFLMYYSYFNMQGNLMQSELQKLSREMGLRKGAGRALYLYMLGFAVPAFLSAALTQGMSGDGYDEDKDGNPFNDLLKMFFGAQFDTATAIIPGGSVLKTSAAVWNKKPYDDHISASPAIQALESSISAPKSVYEAMTSNTASKQKQAIRDSLTLFGMIFNVPAQPFSKPINYMIDYNAGKARPTGPIDFTRGLVTGKSGATH